MDSFIKIAEKLKKSENIIIFPHLNVDGDALGSSSALCMALKKLRKNAVVYVNDKVPENLDFLVYDSVTDDVSDFTESYTAVMLDCSSLNRIKGREESFTGADFKICLDHHMISEGEICFDLKHIEPDSAATGELVYSLIKELGCGLDLKIAEALFTAITTDTGNFQHSNTTARTHKIAAALYEVENFNSKKISTLLYERNSFSSLRLEAMMTENLTLYYSGKIAVGKITRKMLLETGCTLDETEGFVQKIMSINGVEVGALLKESDTGKIRISLRSKSYANVAAVAASFGGGGHIRAAGCTLPVSIEKAEQLISESLTDKLKREEYDR